MIEIIDRTTGDICLTIDPDTINCWIAFQAWAGVVFDSMRHDYDRDRYGYRIPESCRDGIFEFGLCPECCRTIPSVWNSGDVGPCHLCKPGYTPKFRGYIKRYEYTFGPDCLDTQGDPT
jgi:hypothetical protein